LRKRGATNNLAVTNSSKEKQAMSTLLDELNEGLGANFRIRTDVNMDGSVRVCLEKTGDGIVYLLDSEACEYMAETFKGLAAHLRKVSKT